MSLYIAFIRKKKDLKIVHCSLYQYTTIKLVAVSLYTLLILSPAYFEHPHRHKKLNFHLFISISHSVCAMMINCKSVNCMLSCCTTKEQVLLYTKNCIISVKMNLLSCSLPGYLAVLLKQ